MLGVLHKHVWELFHPPSGGYSPTGGVVYGGVGQKCMGGGFFEQKSECSSPGEGCQGVMNAGGSSQTCLGTFPPPIWGVQSNRWGGVWWGRQKMYGWGVFLSKSRNAPHQVRV